MSRRLLTIEVHADEVTGMDREHKVEVRGRRRTDRFGNRVTEIRTVRQKSKGYCVFHCPNCGSRNRRPVIQGEEVNGSRGTHLLIFTCNGCHMRVPVRPPIRLITPGHIGPTDAERPRISLP